MKFNYPLLRLPRRFCAETLAAEVAALDPSAWIPHPGKIPGNDAVPLITPDGAITDTFAGPMAPTPHLLQCPYIMEIMAELGAVWGRSRLMGIAAGAEVPAHVDVGYYWRTHIRIHIPVVTNPSVLFTCNGTSVHMEAGECWAFDSFCLHDVRNGGAEKRIHLVLDTVGGDDFWKLIEEAQNSASGTAEPTLLPPGRRDSSNLAFEQVNAPEIVSPWEVRCHIDFVLEQAPPGPAFDKARKRLDRFAHGWAASWAQFGTSPAGLPSYRRLIAEIQRDLVLMGAGRLVLPNEVPVDRALSELIFRVAIPPEAAGLHRRAS